MGDAQDKIEEFIKLLDRILEFCEDSRGLDQASESFIKENFAFAASLENFYCQLQRSGCIDEMEVSVLRQWKQKGRNVPCEISVFEESCDLLLTACFRRPSLSCKNLSTAVVEYERYCGSSRLQELVVNLLREGISCQLLHSLASVPPSLLSAVFLSWHNMIECGQSSKVRNLISTIINQNPAHVSTIFQLILKPNGNEDTTSLKDLLMSCVINEMKRENSRAFCNYLVNSIDVKILVSVAEKFPSFLTSLLECLEILADGSELECKHTEGGSVEYSWKGLGFPLNLVQQLCKHEGSVSSRTLTWLMILQTKPGCSFWEDIAACCGV